MATRPAYRLPWAQLLARTFAIDILACGCGAKRRVLAFVPDRRIGLSSEPAHLAPARWSSQDELDPSRDYAGPDPPFADDVGWAVPA